jgi:hypothetical protein
MNLEPAMMALVAQRGLSTHPSVVAVRDQVHALFLDYLKAAEVPSPTMLSTRDRYLIASSMTYALGIARVLGEEAAGNVAILIAALLVEVGFQVVLDDDDGDTDSNGPGLHLP